MTASVALNNALSGLNVNQKALTVLSQNIANANTPGYSRQVINQEAVSLAGVDAGVSIDSITRKIDTYLTTAAQSQNSTVGQTSTLNDYYTKIQLLLGSPANNDSIDSYINNFFNSVQGLAQSPNNTTLQQATVSSGVTVATQINQLSQGLSGLQFQADQDINSAVQQVNTDLSNIFQLNKTIAQSTVAGQSTADLEDQRDSLVTDISQYMNVKTFPQTDGSLFMTTAGGNSLLGNSLYQLSYTPATSSATFSSNGTLSPLTLTPVDSSGNPDGTVVQLITAGTTSQITSLITTGKIAALTTMRDQTLPAINSQLDSLASALTTQVNAINNSGSGYPGANSLTGATLFNAAQVNQWSGQATIAVLNSNGQPIASPYTDETYGMQPLTLNLGTMDTGDGAGKPSVQGIINAINQYYGVPQNKVEVGNLNNIQLISNSPSLPAPNNLLNLGFNLNNISGSTSNFYVSNLSVTDSNGNAMPVSSTIPTVALDPTNTYTTGAGSNNVIVNTSTPSNFTNGQLVYLSTPPAGPDLGGTYSGIAPASLGGYFTVSNVTSTGFQISVNQTASGSVTEGAAGQTVNPPYSSVPGGSSLNTQANGTFSVDMSGHPASTSYTVTATVGVDDGSGNIKTSQITYQVYNNQPSLLGTAFAPQTATGSGTIVTPTSSQPIAVAKLVNAQGVELPKINGQYVTNQNGYLQIQTSSGSTFLAINSQNSQEQGQPNVTPPVPGTNLGFSSYFHLNDFFQPNPDATATNSVAGSAINLSVESRIQSNNGLMSLGQLSQGTSSIAAGAPPNYTYQLNPGDGSIAEQLGSLGSVALSFPAAGGVGATTQTLSGYMGQVIGAIATNASNTNTTNTNAQALLTSYNGQASAISGVNLDTELANTVIYQNAYAASARIVSETQTFFDSLLQAFNG